MKQSLLIAGACAWVATGIATQAQAQCRPMNTTICLHTGLADMDRYYEMIKGVSLYGLKLPNNPVPPSTLRVVVQPPGNGQCGTLAWGFINGQVAKLKQDPDFADYQTAINQPNVISCGPCNLGNGKKGRIYITCQNRVLVDGPFDSIEDLNRYKPYIR